LAANVYEGMFILDSNRYARKSQGVAGQLSEMVEKLGGEVLASRVWNEQRLAYPIKGQRKGTYWLMYFRLEGSQLSPLARATKLNENVLRNLVIKLDPRLVDAMVGHALGETPEEAPAKETPAKETPAKETAAKEAPADAGEAVAAVTEVAAETGASEGGAAAE